jgi:hypothetical protein
MVSARRVDSEPVLRALELICKMFMVRFPSLGLRGGIAVE